jgi:hypothetical protein
MADVRSPSSQSENKAGFMSNLATKMTSSVGSAASAGKASVVQASSDYGITIIIGIIVAIVFFIIAYMLYLYLARQLTNKIIFEVPDTSTARKGTVLNKIDGSGLPSESNGSRMTFMFWIYINDLNMYAGDLRHVMHIGDKSTVGASPEVYLDGIKNRLYVRFSKDTDIIGPDFDTKTGPTDLVEQVERGMKYLTNPASKDKEYNAIFARTKVTARNPVSQLDAIKIDLAKHGVVIDYVPLQRWVHVAIVVNETVNRGYIKTYLDGEIVASVTSDDNILLSGGESVSVDFTGLNLTKKGDLYIGGDVYDSDISRGFGGLVSRVTVSNYDMNGAQIKSVYVRGPLDNITSKLGMGAYGLRNPVYKVGA